MIPNETNTENSRNNFVQIRLGELCEQKEVTISEIVERPKRKIQDLTELDEETRQILEKYHQYLRQNYSKSRTVYNYYIFTKLCLQWMGKPAEDITMDDLLKWKEHIIHTYKKNGNARRVMSVNHFTKWLGREDLKLAVPTPEHSNKIVLSEQELSDYIDASRDDSLLHLITLFQIDGLLRPSEFNNLKTSNMDLDNQKFYLDDTKTGNNYIILSPRLIEAIQNYLPHRKPLPEFENYLIIIPRGRYKGRPPTPFGGFINNQTKKIARRAGITKYVSPYIVKPSAITNDFNNNVNPKIIQRKARHRKIETTLVYDHTTDEMVRKHFEKQQVNTVLETGTNGKYYQGFDYV